MSTPPAFREVQALNNVGRYEEALALLDRLPDTGVHLWLRGWALHHIGRQEEAHEALGRARPLLDGNNLGRMWMDWAALYGHERRFARAYDQHVRALQLLRGDASMTPLALYNLGWQHLTRLQFDLARARLLEAMEVGERTPDGALERVVSRVGVSTLERVSGNAEGALARARWAAEVAVGHRYESMAYRAQAQAWRHLGDLLQARAWQARAAEVALSGTHAASERLMLALIDHALGRPVDLEAAKAGALPLDALRADLHSADAARRAGCGKEALARLRAVLARDEPYPVQDEAPMLVDLYAFGRAEGLPLPEGMPRAIKRELVLRTLGRPGLRVAGAEVPVTSERAFAVLAYVALYGQTRLAVLGAEVFPTVQPEQRRVRVRSSLSTVARWLGDPQAITLQDDLVVPSGRWHWQVDVSEVLSGEGRVTGAFLPGLYTDWTGRVQTLLDNHLRVREEEASRS